MVVAPAVLLSSLRHRLPEIVIVLVGLGLRLTMAWSFSPEAGYDFESHWAYVGWVAREGSLPTLTVSVAASHPPFFYVLAAALVRLGGGPSAVQMISIVAGMVRLPLLWLGFEIAMPGARVARRVALALAAVLPVAVHMDGTVSGESLGATLVALALVFVPSAFGEGRRATAAGVVVGIVLGLALLTKVTALTVCGALGVGWLVRFAADRRASWRDRLRRLAPALAALVACVATAGWWFAWNQGMYGKPIATYFDTPGLRFVPATLVVPVWLRRPPEFYLGWDSEIFTRPHYPSAALHRARFFPQLVASTFVDYYNFSFARTRPGLLGLEFPQTVVNDRPLPRPALALGRASMLAGTLIAAVTAAAWLVAVARTWSTGAWDRLALLLVALGGLGAQLYYAQVYPIDWLGVVKGAYVLYAAPPLFAAFGLGVAWLARRARPLAAIPLLGLCAVAVYTVWCRTA